MALPIAGPDARPLLTSQPLRTASAFLMTLIGLALTALALFVSILGESPALFFGALLFLLGTVATAAVADRGWHRGRFGGVERAGIALLTLICLGIAGLAAWEAVATVRGTRTLGSAPSDAVLPLALLALALFALAVMAVVLPLGSGRGRRNVGGAAVVIGLLSLLAGGGMAVAQALPDDAGCGRFDFDTARWKVALRDLGSGDANLMAKAIVRCDLLPAGSSAVRARALLGIPPTDRATSQSWMVGEPAGFSFGEYLALDLTEDGRRVASVSHYVD